MTGGLVAWIAVGVPVMIAGANSRTTFIGWAVSFLIFGGAFAFASWRPRIGALIVETAAVMAMVLLLCNGFEGTLLVLVAMQLPGLVSRRGAIEWIIIQSILLFTSIAIHWSPRPAFLLTPPYLGFQLLAYLAFEALAREAAARRDLERAHAELQALHGILIDSSRIAERLRIARDLHDSLGHHLTALSLNL
jgi:signal transduction histidine kinase